MTWTGFTRTSTDGGKTWSKAEVLPAGFFGPVRAKPLRLADGTLLAPTSLESHRCWTPYVDRSTDDGATWTRSNPFNAATGHDQIQPTLFEAKPGTVVALMRSKNPLKVMRAVSTDGGKTFSPAEPTDLFNPNSGIDAVKTPAGDVFLVYNPVPVARTPLSLARSTDDGKTWAKVLDLETELGEFSYPAMVLASDGKLHLTYTWKRKHIFHAVADPAKLRG
jgi:predicted neuraminidase